MTDQPGREPEQRLPVPRPPLEPAPADRFTSPPSARRFDLTPERAAKIVRQSANARFVGFLAIAFISIFVILYYFYEVGVPGVASTARVTVGDLPGKEAEHQQVVNVERGYNLYQANCARCHGANGEGGIGPTLNDQSKLFDPKVGHLNVQYLRNVLTVGGRYVCGDANSAMPIWSNTNGGPLNYRQIEELIAFLRATNDKEYAVRDPETLEPEIEAGKPKTFRGWTDPNWKPAPDSTPFPACWTDAFASGASPTPAGPAAPAAATLQIAASQIQFDKAEFEAPAGKPFAIEFDNQDSGIPHNVAITKPDGSSAFTGDIFNGPDKRTYNVPALDAGSYTFVCTVHPNMTGTLTVK